MGLLLNLSPDHLDRYPDFSAYVAAKARLFARQTGEDTGVLNADDPLAWETVGDFRRQGFSRKRVLGNGAYLQGDRIVVAEEGRPVAEIKVDRLELVGAPNQENVMASVLAARAFGLDAQKALEAAAGFKGLPHRVQLVAEIGGVSYYDDSKATNPGAVAAALAGFDTPIVLIAGGRDKDSDMSMLRGPVRKKVRKLILIGEAAEKMAKVLAGLTEIIRAGDMSEAVVMAAKAAAPGDTVLLSPACASFDMFDDYAHRGRVFAELVRRLEG